MLGSKIFLMYEMFWLLLLKNIKMDQIVPHSDTENLAKPESARITLSPGYPLIMH